MSLNKQLVKVYLFFYSRYKVIVAFKSNNCNHFNSPSQLVRTAFPFQTTWMFSRNLSFVFLYTREQLGM